ncbi:Trehalose-6-phosphate phosphatase [Corynebacterium occultum]|uniref:Trehalose 6-phosphate phosphatase n=1 Tax=Corynebacterium occultum TaxID=2675219 RepID=A0A6B8VZ33_9CORY|nr:Trehalose-6-phosphate phosphatase [Corynebacterium occultum]
MTVSLHDLATTDQLLLVSDFDGTIAGLSPDAYDVPVNRDSLAALSRLAGLPNTTVAVLTGRHLAGLARVCELSDPVVLAGSHGAENSEHGVVLTEEQSTALAGVERQLRAITEQHPPAFVELKPLQRVVHVAALAEQDPDAAARVLARAALVEHPGATMAPGKNIIEFSVSTVDKGDWIAAERERRGASATVFIGDDTTDENGFRVLGSADLGIKVGEGATAAGMRVADRAAVAAFLAELAGARARHTGIPVELGPGFRAIAAGMTAEVLRVHDWDAQTPCEQWVARDIICHLCDWYPRNLRLAGVELDLRCQAATDPVGAWQELVAKVQLLLDDPVTAQAVFADGPDRGSTVGAATKGYFLPDVFMHTWDLARSQGHDVELDEDYAQRNLHGLESQGELLQDGGKFGVPQRTPEGASAGLRLMAHVGRRPDFGLS